MVSKRLERIPLTGQFYFLDDPSGVADLHDVLIASRNGRFEPLPGTLGRGYTNAASWLRLDIFNTATTEQDQVLRLSPQMLDNVDIYVEKVPHAENASQYGLFHLGDHVPASSKNQAFTIMGVPLRIPAGEKLRLYIRLQTSSSHLIGAELVTQDRYARDSIATLFWVSGYVAIAMSLSFITFLHAIRLRDLTHGLYGFLALGLSLNMMGTEGLAAILLPSIAHKINDGLVGLSVMLSFGGLSLFAMNLFRTKTNHRWGHRYLQLIITLCIAAFVSSGTQWYALFVRPLNSLGLLYWIFLTWAASQMIRRGEQRSGHLFLLAFTIPMIGAAVGLSRYLGWLPQNDLNQYILPVTSLIHLILMKLVLSERLLEAEARFREASQRVALEAEHRRDHEQLISMISHEIRNPIAVIDAVSQSLQLIDPDPATELSERYLRIQRSSERLTMLLNILEQRPVNRSLKESLIYHELDPASFTREIIGMLEHQERERFYVDVSEDLGPIAADLHLLRFAWLNLIENSCKYSTLGTQIHIRIAGEQESGQAGIAWSIRNEGPSIAPGMEERIFEKYQRGTHHQDVPGFGLGLFLARHIIEMHEGYLKSVSDPDGGFFVSWIPCHPLTSSRP